MEIAALTYSSGSMVKTHTSSAHRKIQIGNRVEAVLCGVHDEFQPDRGVTEPVG